MTATMLKCFLVFLQQQKSTPRPRNISIGQILYTKGIYVRYVSFYQFSIKPYSRHRVPFSLLIRLVLPFRHTISSIFPYMISALLLGLLCLKRYTWLNLWQNVWEFSCHAYTMRRTEMLCRSHASAGNIPRMRRPPTKEPIQHYWPAYMQADEFENRWRVLVHCLKSDNFQCIFFFSWPFPLNLDVLEEPYHDQYACYPNEWRDSSKYRKDWLELIRLQMKICHEVVFTNQISIVIRSVIVGFASMEKEVCVCIHLLNFWQMVFQCGCELFWPC